MTTPLTVAGVLCPCGSSIDSHGLAVFSREWHIVIVESSMQLDATCGAMVEERIAATRGISGRDENGGMGDGGGGEGGGEGGGDGGGGEGGQHVGMIGAKR